MSNSADDKDNDRNSRNADHKHDRDDRKNGLGLLVIALYCVMAVLLVVSFLLTRKAAQASGVCRVGKLRFRLFASKGTPIPLYLCSAVWVACIAASILLGSAFAYYCVHAAAGALFIAACYYTIKLD